MFLCVFGLHRYYLVLLYKKLKSKKTTPKTFFIQLPKVTVQLPIYNEMYVVERLIKSVCEIDYPKNLLEIQVLDDSTDKTSEITCSYVERYKKLGFDIRYVHRKNRLGFKAGALNHGLKLSSGEFLAIFDADFIPPKDFLKRTIHYFSDPSIGVVQTRWGHVNQNYSLLTKAQSILLDGHFIIEQTTRYLKGLFFNFNGTAGIIRKDCIKSSGGWQHDTLTEDLDLSYRAQVNGWRLVYLKDLISNAELPVDMNAFKSQQFRWAKGGTQTAKKLLWTIFSNKKIPLRTKLESAFHLLGNFSYLFLLILIILMVPMGMFWSSLGWKYLLLISVFAISAGTFSIVRFYILAISEAHKENAYKFYKFIPLAIGLGTGIAVNNSKAVLEAMYGKITEFKRTPKYAVVDHKDNWKTMSYVASKEITTIIEFCLGIVFTVLTALSIYKGYISWIPFLLLIQFGFIYTSFLSIYHSSRKHDI
ncbi:MAG: glycosyltransferase [Candidatus Dadabacteria bacterium]|nr:glycosyltransferase [Candidatus Dadabacteria bacterium]